MRIVYLHQYFNTPAMSGGTRSYEMGRRFAAAGHDVHIITSDRSGVGGKGWRVEMIDGVSVHWFPVEYDNSMSYARRVRAFVEFAVASARRAASLRGAVVFATSTPLTIAIPGVFAKRRMRVPMVFEVRDLWPELPIAMGALRNPVLRWAAHVLEKWAYQNSDQVIALSPGMAEGVANAGYPREKVHVVPNSCDLDLFAGCDEAGAAFRLARPWLGQRPLVVYAGTFGHINDVEYLVSLAAEMRRNAPDVAFLAVGAGTSFDAIENLARQRGVLGVNFFLEGPMAKQDIPALLNAATICTSLFKPIPAMEANSANKFFDALAAGRPVAINYGGWQADLLAQRRAGLVLSRDPADAAASVVELIGNSSLLHETGLNARLLAETDFSRDQLAEQLLAVLDQSAAARG
ncbi:glycosyl transferase family 1 [Nocardioides sp. Root122]|uniref:glycosyltransferase family 4 protein n=1 Tax=Nocardioides TaxID=1839 RepID=UPI0007025750|nr:MULTISPECIES: glycosyltransferase family 4 protein [Nocardioides]KQV77714.1 glycosyl transferase family 1 [Nocardioides sp. Root122]MCK9822179.1 glycosyltransferase family 4 protein [Nocardioides cavernae]